MCCAPGGSEPTKSCQLERRDCFERMPERHARAGLDFDERGLSAIERDHVDLTLIAAPIAVENRVARVYQERGGELFPASPQFIFCSHDHLRHRGWLLAVA